MDIHEHFLKLVYKPDVIVTSIAPPSTVHVLPLSSTKMAGYRDVGAAAKTNS